MQDLTWKALVAEFGCEVQPVEHMAATDRAAMELLPLVGVAGYASEADGESRRIVASPLFIGWATPAWAVFTLGHETGHIVCGHNSLAHGRRLANEVQADIWGVHALEAYGFDPRESVRFLGSLIVDWNLDTKAPGVVEVLHRILALSDYLEHRDVERTMVTLPLA